MHLGDLVAPLLRFRCLLPTTPLPRSNRPEQGHTPRESHRRDPRVDQKLGQLEKLIIGTGDAAAQAD